MYLDAATRTYVEETGGANFIFVTKDKEIVIPKSESILPSITKKSILYIAENYLDLKVTERPVKLEELKDFAEAGLCGTAAVISPVAKVVDGDEEISFPSGMEEMGAVTKKLYDTLTKIQLGDIEAPDGWIRKIV
jgi:branched-chain amino acid aminotransferase